MKKNILLLLAFISTLAYSLTLTDLKTALSKKIPNEIIVSVVATPVASIYEVSTPSRVFYTDEAANYIFVGNLIDINNKVNLTEVSLKKIAKANWDKLPLELAFISVKGNGKNKLAVFTDIDCTFCKRLEADTLSKLENATIYYFLYINPMHSSSLLTASKIICSENKSKSYLDYMLLSKPLPTYSDCTKTKELGQIKDFADNVLHIEVTPTIITYDGEIIKGLVPPNYLTHHIGD